MSEEIAKIPGGDRMVPSHWPLNITALCLAPRIKRAILADIAPTL